jgi:hypothetical protein
MASNWLGPVWLRRFGPKISHPRNQYACLPSSTRLQGTVYWLPSLLRFSRFAWLRIGRGDHRRNALINLRVQLGLRGLTNMNAGIQLGQQFEEPRRQRLHQVVLFPEGLSEFGSDGHKIWALFKIVVLFHNGTAAMNPIVRWQRGLSSNSSWNNVAGSFALSSVALGGSHWRRPQFRGSVGLRPTQGHRANGEGMGDPARQMKHDPCERAGHGSPSEATRPFAQRLGPPRPQWSRFSASRTAASSHPRVLPARC